MGTKLFNHNIDLNEIYYVCYSDNKRELDNEKMKNYNRIQSFPEKVRLEALMKLPLVDNPKVNIMTGRELCQECEKGFILLTDPDFITNHKVTLLPASAMDFYIKHSKKLNKI